MRVTHLPQWQAGEGSLARKDSQAILPPTGPSCQYCRMTLTAQGYHFTCHLCGATFCYIHMSRHSGAHREAQMEGGPTMAAGEHGIEDGVLVSRSELAALLGEIRELRALLETPSGRPSPRAREGA
ncbi:MAG: hypothetical protein OK455_04540 [Thaumarchaeota archaeon]|nr:hypothetical protein [Nitrososphaerota archaeon]